MGAGVVRRGMVSAACLAAGRSGAACSPAPRERVASASRGCLFARQLGPGRTQPPGAWRGRRGAPPGARATRMGAARRAPSARAPACLRRRLPPGPRARGRHMACAGAAASLESASWAAERERRAAAPQAAAVCPLPPVAAPAGRGAWSEQMGSDESCCGRFGCCRGRRSAREGSHAF
jgi:hypothetical protein